MRIRFPCPTGIWYIEPMSQTKDIDKAAEFTAPFAPGEAVTPEHAAWMKAQTRETLDKIERGEMTYRSLDEVMRAHGFDAR